ncbi:hypothetical protein ACFC6U_11910 [Kitasatospora purpeofusca]|uniref:hypothetical protein n=1 Tax=Kitasatospora purpeofusca TaxID=67352 RepID=UPI0035E2A289
MNRLLARAAGLAAVDSPSARTLVIDFDGVIHPEGPWDGGRMRGAPLPGAVDRIRALLDGGWRIAVITARGSEHHETVAQYLRDHLDRKVVLRPGEEINYWETEHVVLVGNTKPGAVVYLDDNGEHFTGWDTAFAGLPDSPDDLPRVVLPAQRRAGRNLWWLLRAPFNPSPTLVRAGETAGQIIGGRRVRTGISGGSSTKVSTNAHELHWGHRPPTWWPADPGSTLPMTVNHAPAATERARLAALGAAQNLTTAAGAAAAALAVHRALRGRRPADERITATALAAIAAAVLAQEILDTALAPLRRSAPDRHPLLDAPHSPPLAAGEQAQGGAPLTMRDIETAACSAAAYEARINAAGILGADGPLREHAQWAGDPDGSATLDLPFGAVLRYRPVRSEGRVRTAVPWEERFTVSADGEDTTVLTGADLLAVLEPLADGRPEAADTALARVVAELEPAVPPYVNPRPANRLA